MAIRSEGSGSPNLVLSLGVRARRKRLPEYGAKHGDRILYALSLLHVENKRKGDGNSTRDGGKVCYLSERFKPSI